VARERDGRDDTDLVLAARAGDGDAFGVLFDRWFDRVWDVAWRIVRDREVAAEVAQDVFLAAWQGLAKLREPAAFGGWLLRTSRNRALNRLERERRSTPAGGTEDPVMAALPGDQPDPATDLEDRSRDELVWAAAAALGERDSSMLDLHLRHGLTPAEIAEALDVAPNHAHQLLFRLKDRLGAAIRSWVLWRHGVPRCTDLQAALAGAGVTGFGPQAVRAIGRHADDCSACAADRDEVLAPDRLFAVVPIAMAPPLLKAKAAAALQAEGVPMSGSDVGSDGGGADGDDTSPGRRRPPWRGLVASGVAAVVVIVGLVVALAGRAGDGELRTSTAADGTGSTDAPVAAGTAPSVETTTTASTAPPPTDTTEPRRPGTSDPPATETPTTPPSTAPPTTAPPTTTTNPPEPPPTIGGFRATHQVDACGPGTLGTAVVWQSSGGTTQSIAAPNGSTTPVGANGSQSFCPHQPGTWTFIVAGPGGTTRRTVSL
jgi:RNA polymerase sigma factor (sigma-70 family)